MINRRVYGTRSHHGAAALGFAVKFLGRHNSFVVRILWFKETTRWSRRGIPLRIVWVSPRQLALLAASLLIGFLFSVPLPDPTLRLVAMGTGLFSGAIVAFWPVKMLTPEQLLGLRMRMLSASLYRKTHTALDAFPLRSRSHQLLQPERS